MPKTSKTSSNVTTDYALCIVFFYQLKEGTKGGKYMEYLSVDFSNYNG